MQKKGEPQTKNGCRWVLCDTETLNILCSEHIKKNKIKIIIIIIIIININNNNKFKS